MPPAATIPDRPAVGATTKARSVATDEQALGDSRQRVRQGGPGDRELERRPRACGQIRDCLVYGAPIHAASLVRIREQQAMIGEDVDDARDSSGAPREPADRPPGVRA